MFVFNYCLFILLKKAIVYIKMKHIKVFLLFLKLLNVSIRNTSPINET